MELLITLSPIALLIGLSVFLLVIKKGFKKTIKYTLGIPIVVITLMALITFFSSARSGSSLGWGFLLIAMAAIVCFVGSITGLLLGFLYTQYLRKIPNKSLNQIGAKNAPPG